MSYKVENQVGLVRERFFSPRLRVKSYDELNAWLLDLREKQARSIRYQITIAKLPLAKDVDDFAF